MSQLFYTQAPRNNGHSHFANPIIQSFPDLHSHETFEQKDRRIREHLTYQMLTTKADDAKNYILMRDCFKLDRKPLVQLCLKEKVPGVSFVEAATKLGYRKI